MEIDKCLVLGTIRKAFEYSLPPQSKILVANFKDDAFYRFFGNISMFKNVSIHPDELSDENCFTSLWHELNGMDNINLQVDHILEFCKPYLQHPDKIAEQLTDFTAQGLSPIKAIAGINGQTERNIQRKQKTRFGYSIKEMNRYKRFLKAVEYMEHLASETSKVDWFAIINQCGYYDQSQLINDFKYYLALSPTKYLKFQKDICNPIH